MALKYGKVWQRKALKKSNDRNPPREEDDKKAADSIDQQTEEESDEVNPEKNEPVEESAELVDLHVLILPRDLWSDKHQTAHNTSVHQAISAGFVNTYCFSTLFEIRNAIASQLGDETIPDYYIFLRTVGRSLVAVHRNQETKFTASDFVECPHSEIVLLPCGGGGGKQRAINEHDETVDSNKLQVELLRGQLETLRMESGTLQKSKEILIERRKELNVLVQRKNATEQENWKQKYISEKSKTEHLEVGPLGNFLLVFSQVPLQTYS